MRHTTRRRVTKCSSCGGRRLPAAVFAGKSCTRCGHVEGRPVTQADKDAAFGNRQISRSEFVLERMRQEGCTAIEASHRFRAGER